VVPLHVPALREHNEDVPDLLAYYVDYFATHEKLPYRRFSVGAQNFLRNYGWPGNVRELKNLVQRVLILGAGTRSISRTEVEAPWAPPAPSSQAQPMEGLVSFDQPLRQAREQFEKAYLDYQLEKHAATSARWPRRPAWSAPTSTASCAPWGSRSRSGDEWRRHRLIASATANRGSASSLVAPVNLPGRT
jgi:DNA-binding NtrC family response regulator